MYICFMLIIICQKIYVANKASNKRENLNCESNQVPHYLLSPFKCLEPGLSCIMHTVRLYTVTV